MPRPSSLRLVCLVLLLFALPALVRAQTPPPPGLPVPDGLIAADADNITYTTHDIFHQQTNISIHITQIIKNNLNKQTLTLTDKSKLNYNHLILTTKTITNTKT